MTTPTLDNAPDPVDEFDPPSDEIPERLGRYRVIARLDRGGFGTVYSAYDEQLHRKVAIKVPHRDFIMGADDGYAREARILAKLDHPNIVPVFDVEPTTRGSLLIVSKFIDGTNYAKALRLNRPTPAEAASLIATMADALHYAHTEGLVHRDIKPANILLDGTGRPYLADFGLALREEDFGTGPQGAGTYQYMSPEQARCEAHRVDGRSDIFSLGVVFYEALTGRRPFHADKVAELLDQITSMDPRPPRQISDAIPKELERICLKALSKPAIHRFTTAKDMADELRSFLAAESPVPVAAAQPVQNPVVLPARDTPPLATPASSRRDATVVPKGLRSFEASDAGFFPQLMPGPRDRDGLPESLRFWRDRIAVTDGADTFTVGLLYGPSGSGKSSLVKAGLLPVLPVHVEVIYIEAAPGLTEDRLLRRLRGANPEVPAKLTLSETILALRRAGLLTRGRKLLLVIDQFEQWLHSRGSEPDCELVRALRQCDGGRVQCLLLVRDDFWMATTRLMRELEIPIVEGENAAAADLFDERHARKVLTMLGRAHGALAEDLTAEQKKFVDTAVSGLSEGGKIVPVRLALFSEMVKSREWVPSTLKAIGGIAGLGVTFLEEAFTASTAPARNRLHQPAARAVLKTLLPEEGHDIKGAMRSRAQLLEASGYASRPDDFEELMRILHRELRLVSPSDPQGLEANSSSGLHPPEAGQHYQLTHDYLVGSLQDWLTRQQRQTRKGRAEILLAERSAVYEARPRSRNLPTFLEWAAIRRSVRSRDATPAQRTMMRRADRHYLVRSAGVCAAFFIVLWLGLQVRGEMRADALHARLLAADPVLVPGIIEEMSSYRRWVDPKLRDSLPTANRQLELKLRLALLPSDPQQSDKLFEQLFLARAEEFQLICSSLSKDPNFNTHLEAALTAPGGTPESKLRAICCLAEQNRDDTRWAALAEPALRQIVLQPAAISYWAKALRPASAHFSKQLAVMLDDDQLPDYRRRIHCRLYREFAAYDPNAHLPILNQLTARTATDRKQANLAATLVAIDRGESVWKLLIHTSDPTLRSHLVERLGPCGVDPEQLEARYKVEKDPTARQALILAWGEMPDDSMAEDVRDRIASLMVAEYETEAHPGIHSAAEWLLRKWDRGPTVAIIATRLQSTEPLGNRKWFINRQGQTMAVVRDSYSFLVDVGKERGGPKKPYHYAIATREVTVDEFRQFKVDHKVSDQITQALDCPVNAMTWNLAAEYCNWLSKKNGLMESDYCYELDPLGDMVPVDGWERKLGYRLPTWIELQVGCLAGANGPFSCGQGDEDLLGRYAVTFRHSLLRGTSQYFPVGSRMPGPLGLFDVEGNVRELCHERFGERHGAAVTGKAADDDSRFFVAGSYLTQSASQSVFEIGPTSRDDPNYDCGFRTVRRMKD